MKKYISDLWANREYDNNWQTKSADLHKQKEFRSFATFNVTKKNSEDHDLSFRSKGKEIVIGSFLNGEDKLFLREEISRIIQRLNALGFAS